MWEYVILVFVDVIYILGFFNQELVKLLDIECCLEL